MFTGLENRLVIEQQLRDKCHLRTFPRSSAKILVKVAIIHFLQANIEKKQQRARWVLNTVNTYFFVQVATWACFMLAYSDYEDLTGL